MEYEAPKLDVIELDENDIIQTSANNGEIGGGGGENEGPFTPFSLDNQY